MIVPLAVTVTAILIGFCFYVHQSNWCRGAAYESAVKSVERGIPKEERNEAANRRMSVRISEMPVTAGKVETTVRKSYRVSISWQGTVLESVFKDRFGYKGSASLTDFDPVSLKRIQFISRRSGKQE